MNAVEHKSEGAKVVSVTPVAVQSDSRTFKQASTLASMGYHSVVFEGKRSQNLKPGELNFEIVSQGKGIHEVKLGGDIGSRPSFIRKAWRALRWRRHGQVVNFAVFVAYIFFYLFRYVLVPVLKLPRADTYILHEFSLFPAVWLRTRFSGAKLIYDVHDFYSRIRSKAEMSPFEASWLNPFHLWIERACIKNSEAIMTVSQGLATDFADYFGVRPEVVYHYHDFRLDRIPEDTLRSRLSLDEEGVTLIVTVGAYKPGMAVQSLLKAMTIVQEDVHWAAVGPGYEVIEDMVFDLGLSGRVHMVGALPANKIVPFIKDADIGIVIYFEHSENYRYALPNGFFQVIAAKLPVLYSPLPEIESMMRKHSVGIEIDLGKPEHVAEQIQGLIRVPEMAGSVLKRAQVANECSWLKEEPRFLELVQRVITS